MSKDFKSLLGGALANKVSEEDDVRNKIVIRENLRLLIPPLSLEEINQLESNIKTEGVREPLIIWPFENEYVLVDGHNRYSICKKLGLEFPFKRIEFKDEEDAKDWMIRNQLGRRNLSPEQQSYLRGLRYNREKSQGKRSDLTSGQNDPKSETHSTAATLAKEYNVSEKTIKRDGEFAKGVDIIGGKNPELKKEILKGNSPIKKGQIQQVAKEPQLVDPIIENKEVKTITGKESPKKTTADEIAKIAFEFIMIEPMSPKAFYQKIGRNYNEIDPLEFFQVWHQYGRDNQNEQSIK